MESRQQQVIISQDEELVASIGVVLLDGCFWTIFPYLFITPASFLHLSSCLRCLFASLSLGWLIQVK